MERIGGVQRELIAYAIAEHHAGLPDAVPEDGTSERSTLRCRLDPKRYAIPAVPSPESAFRPYSFLFGPKVRPFPFSSTEDVCLKV